MTLAAEPRAIAAIGAIGDAVFDGIDKLYWSFIYERWFSLPGLGSSGSV